MDLNTFILVTPLAWVIYQGVGMFLDARSTPKWGPSVNVARPSSTQRMLREFTSLSAKLGFNRVFLKNKRLHERLELLLLRAGQPYGWKAEDFLFVKEVIGCVLVGLALKAGTYQPLGLVLTFALGFLLPDLYMRGKGSTRQLKIQRLLPGFIDLLALTLESGLDMLAAVERILEKIGPSPLKEEMSVLIQENRLGTSRKEALQHLAHRVNLPDLQSLTSIIIQSDELGTGLAGILRNYSEDMRNRRILRAEEQAGKAPIKLLFPMVIFFFPIVFVIIFGPLAVNFMSNYK